jgi:hypothetical protein
MSTQIQSNTPERSSSAETVIGFAVLGLLVTGVVGIGKAIGMHRGADVLLCLLGSVAAFGTVIYIYFHKD